MKRLLLILLMMLCFSQADAQKKVYQDIGDKYASGLFRDKNAHTLVPMEDVVASAYMNVFQYLQGRIPGLTIYANAFEPVLRYRSGSPALFLDEVRTDAQMLSNVNMNDIAIIKVFRPPFLGAFGGGSGAIAVYTKNGDE